ncbi:bromodomain and WD repeat-containing protein 1-like [Clarias gariepinus]|uniref:bromodomain and WD repeat-containing protein 1-like n=1 Tax=Clarias gariepinus TaxID=13013 RepID=UPI00234D8B87|nr:bromodomain and WD repeat-containing protein 1-like [Clarias gariepinus]
MEQVISQEPAESEDPEARHSVLDVAIRQLQEQQDQQAARQQGTPRRVSLSEQIEVRSPPTVDLQGSRQVEGVRQMHQNTPRSDMATEMDLQARCRVGVSELTTNAYRDQESYRSVKGEEEITLYNANKQPIEHTTFRDDSDDETPCTKRAKPRKRHRNLENANSLIEFFCEEGEDTASSEDSEIEASGEVLSIEEEEEWRSDSSSHSSSECSDWTADAGITEHTTMSFHVRRQISSSDEDDKKDDNIEDQTEQTQDEDTQSSPQKPKRKEKSETPKEQVKSSATKSTSAKASPADHQDSSESASPLSVNGLSSRSSHAKRRRVCDSSSSDLECSEDEESPSNADDTDQKLQPRKAVVAAVSRINLMYAAEEEDSSEHKPAVNESSSESEEHDHQGTSNYIH